MTPDDRAPLAAPHGPAGEEAEDTGMAFMGGGILGVSLVFLAAGGLARAFDRWSHRSSAAH